MAEDLSLYFTPPVLQDKLKAAVSNAIGYGSVEVVSFDINEITNDTEDCTTTMLRVKVNFIYNGNQFSKMMIMKRMPVSNAKAIADFQKEFQVYNELMKEYTMLLEVTDNYLPLPKCYFTETDGTNDTFIIEDLKDTGFKLGDKLKGLDLDHCLLVIKALGKYHALSVILERKLTTSLDEVYPFLVDSFITSDKLKLQTIITYSLDSLIESVLTVPHNQYRRYVTALSKRFDSLLDESCELIKTAKNKLNVLCHGDCWVKNMMFRYEKNSDYEKPVEVKFINLQSARYAPPSTDIVYFLFTSTLPDFRKQHAETILETYHKSFISTFTEMGVSGPSLTLEQLMKDFEELKPFGVLMSCWLRGTLYYNEVAKVLNEFDEFDLDDMITGQYCSTCSENVTYEFDILQNGVLDLVDEALEVFGLK